MPWKSGAAYSCPIPAFAPNSEPKEMFQCRSFDTIADLLSAGHCPWVLHFCISVFLYLCSAVCLYFCISGLAPLLISWSFCRFSVWGPEVRLSCRDGGQGGSLGGRRLRRGPGGHLSWGEILVATCFEVIFLLPPVLRWDACCHLSWGDILVATCFEVRFFSTIFFQCKNAKDMSNYWGAFLGNLHMPNVYLTNFLENIFSFSFQLQLCFD